MKWYKPGEGPFKVEGLPFFEKEHLYRRLMANPPLKLADDVEFLCGNTAGAQVRFHGTFRELQIRGEVSDPPKMPHMPTVGESGFDCYIGRDGEEPLFYASGSCARQGDLSFGITFFSDITAHEQDVVINFPLYDGVKTLEIGLDDDAVIEPPKPHKPGRLLIYGSSIDHGAAASRPGLCFSNILSRWFDTEVINLGFSGSGRYEESSALAVREVPGVTMFLLNGIGNCEIVSQVLERVPAFIARLRERYPETPILLYSLQKRSLDRYGFDGEWTHEAKALAVKDVFDRLAPNDPHLYYTRVEGEEPFDGHVLSYEMDVDGCHPNDYGFMQMAKWLYQELKRVAKAENIAL